MKIYSYTFSDNIIYAFDIIYKRDNETPVFTIGTRNVVCFNRESYWLSRSTCRLLKTDQTKLYVKKVFAVTKGISLYRNLPNAVYYGRT